MHDRGELRLAGVHGRVSGQKSGILAEPEFRLQIGDTPRRSEIIATHRLQRFTLQFKRTAVIVIIVASTFMGSCPSKD
jgi:hypothetical protein